jgi:cytidylate kinase
MAAIDLITISREYGAGASRLGALLGEQLGWRVLDADIPSDVAGRLGLPPDALAEWDEHAPGLLESIGNAFILGSPELLIDAAVAVRPPARDVAAATKKHLLARAETPPLVIVGHGAQVIFADRPGSLHLRLVAPLAVRAARIAERHGLAEREAAELARRVDADRAHYVRDFHGRDVTDPLLYDLQINTGTIEMRDVVALVGVLVHQPS